MTATDPPVPAFVSPRIGVGSAVLAAVLFGASTPAVKVLTVDVGANAGAALLYLGSGVGLLLLLGLKAIRGIVIAPIPPAARWRFALAIVAGGVVAPVLLLMGLRTTSASTASLLLNLEGVLTAVVAWVIFRENVDRRILVGMVAIVAGGAVLSTDGGDVTFVVGALFIAGACVGWAVDNNLTQAASGADPFLVAGVKGVVAGAVNLVIAVVFGQDFPVANVGLLTLVAGFCGYGLSLTFFVLGLRHLGTARTGAWFGAAPFVGALVSIVVLDETFGWRLVVAGGLMAVGLWLHLRERHEHEHQHGELEHEHEHVHDEHHQHAHASAFVGEPHTHVHRHPPMTHSHAHTPDLHHRDHAH